MTVRLCFCSQVTLFGESAGAASVMAHMIARESRSLFNNGILQSGAVQNPWALDRPVRAMQKSKAVAKSVGCSKVRNFKFYFTRGGPAQMTSTFGKS